MTISLTPVTSLLERIVERSPLAAPDGKSGSSLERVVMADGRVLVTKRISPAWDWLMRATNDIGRLRILWTFGNTDAGPRPYRTRDRGSRARRRCLGGLYARRVGGAVPR